MERPKQMERTATEINVSKEAGLGYNTPTGKCFTEYEGFENTDSEQMWFLASGEARLRDKFLYGILQYGHMTLRTQANISAFCLEESEQRRLVAKPPNINTCFCSGSNSPYLGSVRSSRNAGRNGLFLLGTFLPTCTFHCWRINGLVSWMVVHGCCRVFHAYTLKWSFPAFLLLKVTLCFSRLWVWTSTRSK